MQGVTWATFFTVLFTAALLLVVSFYDYEPSAEFLRSFATITATLLVAYAVSASWLMRTTLKKKGKEKDSATMAGSLSALGSFSIVGIGVALIYADIVGSPHNTALAQLMTSFAFASAILPMVLVAWQASNEYELHPEQHATDDDVDPTG